MELFRVDNTEGYTLQQLLINQAIGSCEWRGHKMGDFEPIAQHIAVSCCKQCNMQVAINTHPLPNEIDIGGEAVALDCNA